MMARSMKVIAEIARTTSIVQKENTLIDIKIKLNLLSLIPAHRVWQRASMTDYNKNIHWGRFASVNKTNLRHNF